MKLGLILAGLLAGVYSDCVSDSTDMLCRFYYLPQATIERDLDKLCKDMPQMPGCSLNRICGEQESLRTKLFCTKFSILADICGKDMPKMDGCQNYVNLRQTGLCCFSV